MNENALHNSADYESLQEQLIELQTQLQFQEDAIQTLDDVVIRQADALDLLQRQFDELKDRLERYRNEYDSGPPPADEKPPHY